jgi:hypothetical protein
MQCQTYLFFVTMHWPEGDIRADHMRVIVHVDWEHNGRGSTALRQRLLRHEREDAEDVVVPSRHLRWPTRYLCHGSLALASFGMWTLAGLGPWIAPDYAGP